MNNGINKWAFANTATEVRVNLRTWYSTNVPFISRPVLQRCNSILFVCPISLIHLRHVSVLSPITITLSVKESREEPAFSFLRFQLQLDDSLPASHQQRLNEECGQIKVLQERKTIQTVQESQTFLNITAVPTKRREQCDSDDQLQTKLISRSGSAGQSWRRHICASGSRTLNYICTWVPFFLEHRSSLARAYHSHAF